MSDTPPIDVRNLFVDPRMFRSFKSFSDAGFKVIARSNDNGIMVGQHDAAKGYLFKKYNDSTSLDKQAENYRTRIEGALALRTFIDERRLRHIVVPRKWLYELPASFSDHHPGSHPSYVLVVERFKLLTPNKIQNEYRDIDRRVLKELCTVLCQFRRLDSTAKNMPFTKNGKIAFIDTERWAGERAPYLGHIRKYLSSKRIGKADSIFDKLVVDRHEIG